ncbi:phosphoenolpyruvate--protein phosphotransferase [Corynebacterium pilosum]|uniref:Phosphoenolpyruvate-protein phosphotransferase n=1 Tax=Corynebacterium pilosum TaxID=35756 RepID=A0A376CKJ9_9CORY|nr:phosphoenolpyruvate--protein phosphotransferase [Corynebacterium pilosum]STC68835.1 phosphoenolpyruvate-protein phosphotransferase [Corynebacterium pilosum]
MSTRTIIHGVGVSAGTAFGPAVFITPPAGVDTNEPACTNPEEDTARIKEVFQKVADGLNARADEAPETSKAILQATAGLATDRGLLRTVTKELKKGSGVTRAVHDAVENFATKLRKLGGYMAERVTDLYDVRDRAIARLRGLEEPGVPTMTEPSVIVAVDLAPAETATLDPELVRGIITSEGGPTSHTAILAAQLGIPAVVKATGIADNLVPGGVVALDGGVGEIIVSPTQDDTDELAERSHRRATALAGSSGEGATRDGHPVKLLANIGTAEDAKKAAAFDLEGSGLFRTEFLFLSRETAPTVEEQTATYTEVLRAFGGRRVVVRTLDAGADKPLSFANLGEEENPALGRRGLRLSQAREDLLDEQLEALAAAYKETGADLWVMAPMVSTVEETRWFVDKARAAGLPKAGVMVETPAAAIRSKYVLSEADFASIGTNDLSQYTMAADRMEGALSDLLDPWQPAVLNMIKATCEGGNATGKHIGVCGEAGGDPLLALVLVGLGVSSLSMAPSKVNAVRAALRLHDRSTCQQMAAYAVDSWTAEEAKAAVLRIADPVLRDLM